MEENQCSASDRYLTVNDIVNRLQVHEQTVRRWIREGDLQAVELGGKSGYRVNEAEFEAFLAERTTTGKAVA